MTDTILLIGHIHPLALRIGKCLQDEGYQIVIAGKSCSDETPAAFIELSLDDPAELETNTRNLPDFDGAVLMPGWYGHGDFLDTKNTDWEAALTQNFYHMVYAGQAVAKTLIKRNKPGKMLYMSSTLGLRPTIETIVQGTTFTMLESLAKTTAVDLAEHQITVNLIAHGWIELETGSEQTFPTARPDIEQDIPLKRPGLTEELAALIAFMMSGVSAHITGTVIPVDGGALLTKSFFTSPYR